jgi:hypothetical protein
MIQSGYSADSGVSSGSNAFAGAATFSSQFQSAALPGQPSPPTLTDQSLPATLGDGLYPPMPKSLEDTGLNTVLLEDLLIKILLSKGVLSGRQLAKELGLPFAQIIEPILADLKNRLYVAHRTTAELGDFMYALTEAGHEKALRAREFTAYASTAPVPFDEYVESVAMQAIRGEAVHQDDLHRAFADLVIPPDLYATLGPAINSGRGLFIYGTAGNGKTAIAERICQCFEQHIYIPKAIWVDGQILQLYDPQCHQAVEDPYASVADARWILIKRPFVMVGGELTLEALEITYNPLMKVSEAPLQMKANGGVFLIDDFGRQRVNHDALLNRWIVPLEKHVDYLVLPTGKKIQVPFEELIVFSTNLDPVQIVDEAFTRRIPYKINIDNPDEATFRAIFEALCPQYGMAYNDAVITDLIARHYTGIRGFRCCHPRDLLEQVKNLSLYAAGPPELSQQALDLACRNYFTAMECQAP